jgi:hypothetical protein
LPQASLRLAGELLDSVIPAKSAHFMFPFKRGCKLIFDVGPYQVTSVVEEDRLSDLRVGVGISIINFYPGIYNRERGC